MTVTLYFLHLSVDEIPNILYFLVTMSLTRRFLLFIDIYNFRTVNFHSKYAVFQATCISEIERQMEAPKGQREAVLHYFGPTGTLKIQWYYLFHILNH